MAGMETIAIIGGGASGLMAAVEASLALCQAGAVAHVALFEADPERVGRSILATGNGRCNLSNLDMQAAHYGKAAPFVEQMYAVTPPSERANVTRSPWNGMTETLGI